MFRSEYGLYIGLLGNIQRNSKHVNILARTDLPVGLLCHNSQTERIGREIFRCVIHGASRLLMVQSTRDFPLKSSPISNRFYRSTACPAQQNANVPPDPSTFDGFTARFSALQMTLSPATHCWVRTHDKRIWESHSSSGIYLPLFPLTFSYPSSSTSSSFRFSTLGIIDSLRTLEIIFLILPFPHANVRFNWKEDGRGFSWAESDVWADSFWKGNAEAFLVRSFV